MKATARRTSPHGYTHALDVRQHQLIADEPSDLGGEDAGPSPQELLAASLAACSAITMEMYAKRKGWDVGTIEVACDYSPAERGCPTRFRLDFRFPESCTQEQIDRLRVIAAKCPVHRVLEGEVSFEDHVQVASPAVG